MERLTEFSYSKILPATPPVGHGTDVPAFWHQIFTCAQLVDILEADLRTKNKSSDTARDGAEATLQAPYEPTAPVKP